MVYYAFDGNTKFQADFKFSIMDCAQEVQTVTKLDDVYIRVGRTDYSISLDSSSWTTERLCHPLEVDLKVKTGGIYQLMTPSNLIDPVIAPYTNTMGSGTTGSPYGYTAILSS